MPVKPGAEPFAADGSSTGVLVLHGYSGSPQGVRDWAMHLADAGLTVRAPRLPGHGTSVRELSMTRWPDYFAAASRALDELVERCDKVFVMGLSVGGALTLALAEERPEDISGIVTVNALIQSDRWEAKYLLPALRFLPTWPGGVGNDIKKPDQDEGAYSQVSPRALWSVMQAWPQLRRRLPEIELPALVFVSPEDHTVEPVCSHVIYENLGSPDKELIELPDSYHVATMDNDAQTIFDKSLGFVRRLEGADA
jgi:carboxylesterase